MLTRIYAIYIPFSLFGYVLIAAISNVLFPPEMDSPLAILFRMLILAISLLLFTLIFCRINDRSQIDKVQALAVFVYFLFWFFYFIRLGYDFNFDSTPISSAIKSKYVLFGFGICFVSSIALIRTTYTLELKSIFLTSFFILVCGVSFNLYFSINDFLSGTIIESSRLALSRLSPIQLGKYSAFLFIISYGLWKQRSINKIFKQILVGAMFLSLLTIILSGSRTALFGIAFVIFFSNLHEVQLKHLLFFVILIPLAFVFILYISLLIFPDLDVVARILSTGGSNDLSANIRYDQYAHALLQFFESPVFGNFFIEKKYMYAPHNLYLEILMAMGVAGFLMFFVILLLSIIRLNRLIIHSSINEKPILQTLMNLYVYLLIAAVFSLGITTAPELWIVMIISLFVKPESIIEN